MPVNLNGSDVKIIARLEDELGEHLETAVSSFKPHGMGAVSLHFKNYRVEPGTMLKLHAVDRNGISGEMNSYSYPKIFFVREVEMETTVPVSVRDQDGNIEPLTNVFEFRREKELNGDYQIKFAVFQGEGNEQSFPMVENENIIVFQEERFRIKRVNPHAVQNAIIKDVEARHVFFYIIDDYQYDELSKTLRIEAALDHALEPTNVTYEIEDGFDSVLFENFGDETSLALLQKIMERYDANLKLQALTV
jgi:hypothetical protein